MADPRITCELLARDTLAVKSLLTQSRGRQWQEVLGDTGNGKLILQNDDPDLALVEYGDYVRFSLDGAAVFAIVVESIDRVDIAPGEDADEFTTISGRGMLVVLENGVVYPDSVTLDTVPFADTRVFNFAHLLCGCPDSWTTPYDWGDRPTTSEPAYAGKPSDFPPVFSHWVGPEAPDGSGDNQRGDWYFAALLIGLPTARYRLFFGFDDQIEIWMDDVPLFSNAETTIDVTKSVDVYLDGIVHLLSARITNFDADFGPPDGPTGWTAALCTLNPDESVDTEYWATDPSDVNQFVMPFPSQSPGETPGALMKGLILEATPPGSRDVPPLALISLGFDDTVDSNGDAWADCVSPSIQIGTDYLTAFKQIAETSGIDLWFDVVTWTLHAYQGRGSSVAVSYVEASNITDLHHSGKF